jgi:hypothetical protein
MPAAPSALVGEEIGGAEPFIVTVEVGIEIKLLADLARFSEAAEAIGNNAGLEVACGINTKALTAWAADSVGATPVSWVADEVRSERMVLLTVGLPGLGGGD